MAIQMKYLAVTGMKPAPADIAQHEIAINEADGTAWTKDSTDTVIQIGGGGSGAHPFVVRTDIASRDAIPAADREVGLHCYVVTDEKTYVLVGGITNTDWQIETLDADLTGAVKYINDVEVYWDTDKDSGVDYDYDNAANTITAHDNESLPMMDGVNLSADDRLLVGGCDNEAHNGIYKVTDIGSTTSKWILTRVSGFNHADEMKGETVVRVKNGNQYLEHRMLLNCPIAFTIGTSKVEIETFSHGKIYASDIYETADKKVMTAAERDKLEHSIRNGAEVAAVQEGVVYDGYTYDNGVAGVGARLTATANGEHVRIDNTTPFVGKRYLFTNLAGRSWNGVYKTIQIGDATTPAIFEREADFDEAYQMEGSTLFFVVGGALNASTYWRVDCIGAGGNPYVVGADNVVAEAFTTGALTDIEIKTKYEANPDTNAYTDAEKTKLAGIEDNATADMTAAEIQAALDASLGQIGWREDSGVEDTATRGFTSIEWVTGTNISSGDVRRSHDKFYLATQDITPSTVQPQVDPENWIEISLEKTTHLLFEFMGGDVREYDAGTTYSPKDICHHNNKLWVHYGDTDITGVAPPAAPWIEFSMEYLLDQIAIADEAIFGELPLDIPAYDAATTYNEGDVVKYTETATELIYYCHSTSTGNAPTDTNFWVEANVLSLTQAMLQVNDNLIALQGEAIVRDGSVAMDANLSMGGNQIRNVDDPSADQDAATKGYVDLLVSEAVTYNKLGARVYSDANFTGYNYFNGTAGVGATIQATAPGALPAIDGVNLTFGDRLVVNGLPNKAQRGIYYVVNPGGIVAWELERVADWDESSEIDTNVLFRIHEGTEWAGAKFRSHIDTLPVVVGTTDIEFSLFAAPGGGIQDNLTSDGVTDEGLSANQGYQLNLHDKHAVGATTNDWYKEYDPTLTYNKSNRHMCVAGGRLYAAEVDGITGAGQDPLTTPAQWLLMDNYALLEEVDSNNTDIQNIQDELDDLGVRGYNLQGAIEHFDYAHGATITNEQASGVFTTAFRAPIEVVAGEWRVGRSSGDMIFTGYRSTDHTTATTPKLKLAKEAFIGDTILVIRGSSSTSANNSQALTKVWLGDPAAGGTQIDTMDGSVRDTNVPWPSTTTPFARYYRIRTGAGAVPTDDIYITSGRSCFWTVDVINTDTYIKEALFDVDDVMLDNAITLTEDWSDVSGVTGNITFEDLAVVTNSVTDSDFPDASLRFHDLGTAGIQYHTATDSIWTGGTSRYFEFTVTGLIPGQTMTIDFSCWQSSTSSSRYVDFFDATTVTGYTPAESLYEVSDDATHKDADITATETEHSFTFTAERESHAFAVRLKKAHLKKFEITVANDSLPLKDVVIANSRAIAEIGEGESNYLMNTGFKISPWIEKHGQFGTSLTARSNHFARWISDGPSPAGEDIKIGNSYHATWGYGGDYSFTGIQPNRAYEIYQRIDDFGGRMQALQGHVVCFSGYFDWIPTAGSSIDHFDITMQWYNVTDDTAHGGVTNQTTQRHALHSSTHADYEGALREFRMAVPSATFASDKEYALEIRMTFTNSVLGAMPLGTLRFYSMMLNHGGSRGLYVNKSFEDDAKACAAYFQYVEAYMYCPNTGVGGSWSYHFTEPFPHPMRTVPTITRIGHGRDARTDGTTVFQYSTGGFSAQSYLDKMYIQCTKGTGSADKFWVGGEYEVSSELGTF